MSVRPTRNSDGSLPMDRKVTSSSAWSYIGGVILLTGLSAIGGLDFTPLPDAVEIFVGPLLPTITTLVAGYFTSSQNYLENTVVRRDQDPAV